MEMSLLWIPVITGLAAFGCIFIVYNLLKNEAPGNQRMREIAGFIREGARTFLKRELQTISYFIVGLGLVLLLIFWPQWQIAFGFVLGAAYTRRRLTWGRTSLAR
ncbi:hypothetical protein DRO42_02425 [Candidatus Bathyarchaeota archaeon]|nr:MAG: hypothetical protein DRO42_02425 [Candidatus Bathyarchaeota archaeon]